VISLWRDVVSQLFTKMGIKPRRFTMNRFILKTHYKIKTFFFHLTRPERLRRRRKWQHFSLTLRPSIWRRAELPWLVFIEGKRPCRLDWEYVLHALLSLPEMFLFNLEEAFFLLFFIVKVRSQLWTALNLQRERLGARCFVRVIELVKAFHLSYSSFSWRQYSGIY